MRTVALLVFLAAVLLSQTSASTINRKQIDPIFRHKRQATTCPNGNSADIVSLFTSSIAYNQKWDCNLEAKATQLVRQCSGDNFGAGNGYLKLSFPTASGTDAKATLLAHATALKMAANNLNSNQQSSQPYTSIGCSFGNCTSRVDVLCFYS